MTPTTTAHFDSELADEIEADVLRFGHKLRWQLLRPLRGPQTVHILRGAWGHLAVQVMVRMDSTATATVRDDEAGALLFCHTRLTLLLLRTACEALGLPTLLDKVTSEAAHDTSVVLPQVTIAAPPVDAHAPSIATSGFASVVRAADPSHAPPLPMMADAILSLDDEQFAALERGELVQVGRNGHQLLHRQQQPPLAKAAPPATPTTTSQTTSPVIRLAELKHAHDQAIATTLQARSAYMLAEREQRCRREELERAEREAELWGDA